MKKAIIPILLTIFAWISCDDGDVVERLTDDTDAGFNVVFEGSVRGAAEWGERYAVVLAGFGQESDYALVQKTLGTTSGPQNLRLSHVPSSVSTIEVAVVDRLRQRVATVCSYTIPADADWRDTIRLDVGVVDASPGNVLKTQVFARRCAVCHGANGRAAAGLDLTPTFSRQALVGQKATTVPNAVRVVPGNADASFLLRVLMPGGQELVTKYDHPAILNTPQELQWLDIVRLWIENL